MYWRFHRPQLGDRLWWQGFSILRVCSTLWRRRLLPAWAARVHAMIFAGRRVRQRVVGLRRRWAQTLPRRGCLPAPGGRCQRRPSQTRHTEMRSAWPVRRSFCLHRYSCARFRAVSPFLVFVDRTRHSQARYYQAQRASQAVCLSVPPPAQERILVGPTQRRLLEGDRDATLRLPARLIPARV